MKGLKKIWKKIIISIVFSILLLGILNPVYVPTKRSPLYDFRVCLIEVDMTISEDQLKCDWIISAYFTSNKNFTYGTYEIIINQLSSIEHLNDGNAVTVNKLIKIVYNEEFVSNMSKTYTVHETSIPFTFSFTSQYFIQKQSDYHNSIWIDTTLANCVERGGCVMSDNLDIDSILIIGTIYAKYITAYKYLYFSKLTYNGLIPITWS